MINIIVLRALSVEGKNEEHTCRKGSYRHWIGPRHWSGHRISTRQRIGESRSQLQQGEAAANDVVAAILRDGGKALAVQADVRTAAGAERLFAVAEAELGPVDYLVNNAGAILYKPLADVTEEEFDSLFAVNVKGS